MTQPGSHHAYPRAHGDLRTRMALRGGTVTNTIARSGWAVFGVAGAVLMVIVVAFYAANPPAEAADNSVFGNAVGAGILLVPPGAVAGVLFGLLAQYCARAWLRAPTKAERRAARDAAERTARFADHGLRPSSRWATTFESCAKSVTAYHTAVRTVPKGAGREWLENIGNTLDSELSEALRLAHLGESVDPDDSPSLTETARKIADSLAHAKASFAATTDRAAAIALNLRDDSDFVRVRAQLDMLAQQAPNLRTGGGA